jgi:histidyl-tRNA synthetase
MFSNKSIPAVGVSIGIERVFAILEEKAEKEKNIRATETEVLIGSIGKNMVCERLKVCNMLWEHGIKAETLYNDNPKPEKIMKYAFDTGIPLIVWIGEDEINQGILKVKVLNNREEVIIKREDFAAKICELVKENPVLLAVEKEDDKKMQVEEKKE